MSEQQPDTGPCGLAFTALSDAEFAEAIQNPRFPGLEAPARKEAAERDERLFKAITGEP